MQRLPEGAKVIQDDRIAIIWRLPNGDCRAQGKRVSKDCPLTPYERKAYVHELGRSAIFCRFLMDHRGISLAEAWKLTKEARGFDNLRAQRISKGWAFNMAATTAATTTKQRRVRKSLRLNEYLTFQLFCYPGKKGALTYYPTRWAVGFEHESNRDEDGFKFVSQQFMLNWTEDYDKARKYYDAWAYFFDRNGHHN